MSETRVVTPGALGMAAFGFAAGLIGSIDDNTFKGNTIEGAFEFGSGGSVNFSMLTTTTLDFIGQQILVASTVYFLKDQTSFNGTQWTWSSAFNEQIYENAFNASETVTVIFDFRAEQYTTPELVTPYGNQGTIVGDTVAIDIGPNFVLANTVTATNLPPGINISGSLITGTLTDNTGPFEVLVTATNSLGTTTATFTWNTYRLNTNTRIVTPGNIATVFGFIDPLIGIINDVNLKGNIIGAIFEDPGNTFQTSLANAVPNSDFIGQQILIGDTTYFLKDVASFSVANWAWQSPFIGTDMEDGFNAGTDVTVIYNINGVNTFLNSAVNSDINTPIPFPPHFDNR